MKTKRLLSVLAIAILMMIAFSGVSSAYAQSESGGYINAVRYAHLSNALLLSSPSGSNISGTALTVDTEYYVNVTFTDLMGTANISTFWVHCWKPTTGVGENGTDSENNHYNMTWTPSGASGTFAGTPAGFLVSGDCYGPSENKTQFTFTFAWKYSKVANYSDGSNNGWKISIFVNDTGSHEDHLSQWLYHGIAEYMSLTGLATNHGWTTVIIPTTNAALDDPADHLSFTVIANRVWNATAKANATTAHVSGLGYTLGIGNVTFYDSGGHGGEVGLSTSEQVIGTLDAQAVPSTNAGTECSCYMWVTLPDGLAPGKYVYTLIVIVQADS